MKGDFVPKCITIAKEQQEFLNEERRFKLSKFVQAKLDEYIKTLREYRQFMEEK